jgi:hypothetical protein
MHISIDALDSALLLMDNWEHNRRTELKPGHWLHVLSPRNLPGDPLYPSWTWQDGVAEQLVLTQDLADDLIIFTPSERVFLADYLEVLSWYRACKWGPCLLDNFDQGDITVTADRYGSRLNTRAIGVIPAADIDQPEVVWLHLVEMLYALTHPRKAKAMGPELGEKERTDFIREMQRKVAKLAAA